MYRSTNNILTALFWGLEKKIFKDYPLFPLGAVPLGHMLHMNNFWSLPPKNDPHQVWLISAHQFLRRR